MSEIKQAWIRSAPCKFRLKILSMHDLRKMRTMLEIQLYWMGFIREIKKAGHVTYRIGCWLNQQDVGDPGYLVASELLDLGLLAEKPGPTTVGLLEEKLLNHCKYIKTGNKEIIICYYKLNQQELLES